MDDRMIGRTQAQMMRSGIAGAGLSVHELWVAYVGLGGEIGELEIDAFLHHALHLPPRHRDWLARATNRLVESTRIPYTRDLRPEESPPSG
ncbi:hypothetical protein ACT4S5_18520 [Kocuria oceani]|uniref:hypothetical protein n=1 Tax=Kocuria oceani TaxID=988827 RepID=UPI0040365E85